MPEESGECCHADGWVLFAAGGIVIASYIASLSTISEPVAVAILLEDMDRLRSVGTVPREAAELRGRDARL
jgi:hypothetical protein